jgi:hypothetical protein
MLDLALQSYSYAAVAVAKGRTETSFFFFFSRTHHSFTIMVNSAYGVTAREFEYMLSNSL